MAKFVIAGRADCPAFARAELLADTLAASLPDFRVHKVTVHTDISNIFEEDTLIPLHVLFML